MYLQQLELHGFKSFADRTTIHFAPGVTAIVGPNGCGKSNIIDAVRWVLGEQRARLLRAERMDNVIFNGAAGRRRLGMAEVSLVVENTRHVLPVEFTEVKVTRRLFRSGESEYLLNDRACRLRDIQDLFMDTGMGAGAYSVIELKMVEDILSEQAQDRRRLFEEAAGITKYKLRRTQALRKLDSTKADLDRIRDIVDEVGRTVRSLERQAKKAARHKELSRDLYDVAIRTALFDYNRLAGERDALRSERGELDERIEELTARHSGEDARLEQKRTALIERERLLSEAQRALNQHVEKLRELESEVSILDERVEATERSLDRAQEERDEAERRRELLQTRLTELNADLENKQPQLDAAIYEARAAEEERDRLLEEAAGARQKVERLKKKEDEFRTEISDEQRRQALFENRIEMLGDEKERLLTRDAALAEGVEAVAAVRVENKQELDRARRRIDACESELEAAEERLLALQQQMEQEQDSLHEKERLREAKMAEAALLESLLLSQEEAGEAVQFLATNQDWSAKPPVTVADLVACDNADAVAVETILGEYKDCLVVQSDKEIDLALASLREAGKGTAVFVVLERLGRVPVENPISDDRVCGAATVVRVHNARLQPLIDLLFRHTYVVDDLTAARTLAAEYGEEIPTARFVSRSGEWADAFGRIHGGDTGEMQPSATRIGRKERLETLHSEIKSLAARCVQQTARVEKLRAQAAHISVGAVRQKVRTAEQDLARLEQEKARIDSEVRHADEDRRHLKDRLDAVDESIERDRRDLEETTTKLDSADDELRRLIADRESAEQRHAEADKALREAETAYSAAHVQAVQRQHEFDTIQRDVERTVDDLADLDERDRTRTVEMNEYRQRIEAALERKEDCKEQIVQGYEHKAVLDERVQEAETGVADLRSSISDQDVVLREVRRLREAAMQDHSSRQARLAEVNTRLEDLVERTREEYDADLETLEMTPDPDFDAAEARERIQTLRSRIRNMGAVNALALESYEEEKERLDFLTAQQADLEKAEETLIDTITEINTTASQRFTETFARIQQNFARLFEQLFGEGASARLDLPEGEDPLEAPIDIIARPRGKKNVIISQLSGGEKALTATALLFAIYLVKPSPFCILDEVDAPLDDANVHRFMNLLRRFSDSTQFILVTHNKLTMEAADRMYGVTMEQQGVSKLVGVSFDQVHGSEAA